MGETEKAWLACLIDTEGSIFISKVREPRNSFGFALIPCLAISNTYRPILEKAQSLIGTGGVHDSSGIWMTPEKRRRWKDKYEYKARAKTMRIVLPEVLPYLIVKHNQALKMLEFLSLFDRKKHRRKYTPEVLRLYAAIKTLNKKGRADDLGVPSGKTREREMPERHGLSPYTQGQ